MSDSLDRFLDDKSDASTATVDDFLDSSQTRIANKETAPEPPRDSLDSFLDDVPLPQTPPPNPNADNGVGRASTYTSQFGKGAIQAVTFIPKAITGLTHKLDLFGAEEGTTTDENPLYQALTGVENIPEKFIPQNPKYAADFGGQVSKGLGQVVGTVATGGLTGLAKTSPKLFALLSGISQEATSAYEEARAKGASEDDAFKTAVATGALAGPLDSIVPAHMMERLLKGGGGKFTKALLNLALEGGAEALTESGQTVIENAVAKKIYDENRGYWDGVLESGGVGGATGIIASAIISAATGARFRTHKNIEQSTSENASKTATTETLPKTPDQIPSKEISVGSKTDETTVPTLAPEQKVEAPLSETESTKPPLQKIEGDFAPVQDEEIKALNPEIESPAKAQEELGSTPAQAQLNPEQSRAEAQVSSTETQGKPTGIPAETQTKPKANPEETLGFSREAEPSQNFKSDIEQDLKKKTRRSPETVSIRPIDQKQLAPLSDEQVVDTIAEKYLHKFTPAISNSIKSEAKLMKSEIAGGEAGRRIPVLDTEGDKYTHNPSMMRGDRGYQFTAIPSSYPEWYGKLKRPKEAVLKALQKIIEDQGADKGKFVERLKRIILEKKLHGFVDKEAGPIPPDHEFLQAIGRKLDTALQGISEEETPLHRVDAHAIAEYTNSREIQAPEAAQELGKIVQKISEQSQTPYQQELNLQGTEVPVPAPRRSREKSVSSANAEAIATPEKITAADFGKTNRVSAWVEKLLTRQIPSFDIRGKVIEKPQDFAALLQPLRSPLFETLKIAFLDDNETVVHSQILTVGTINQALFSNRDAIATLVEAKRRAKTSRVLIAHNHPSGNPQPSPDDIRTTRSFEQALKHVGLQMVDHIVTNGKTFFSFKAQTVMSLDNPVKAPWEKVSSVDLKIVNEPQIYRAIVENLRQSDPGYVHVLYVNSKLALVAVDRFTEKQVASEKIFHQKVIEGGSSLGASGIFIDFGTGMERSMVNTRLRKLGEALRDAELPIYDAADAHSVSRKSSGTMPSFGASEKTGEYNLREEPSEYGEARSGRNIGSDDDTTAQAITDAMTTGESIPTAAKRLLNKGRLAYESAVDVLRKAGPKLSALADRITRYYDDKENLIGARTAKFTNILDAMSRKERNAAYDEFEKYIKTREDTQNPNREQAAQDYYHEMSSGGKALVDEVKRLFIYTGEINNRLGVKNRNLLTGEIRPTANLGEKYWPRVLKQDVRDVLSNPRKDPNKYNEYLLTIQQKNGFVSLAQAEQFISRSGILETNNAHLGHLEVARIGNLPVEFYENRFEKVIPQFITRWSDRISQIKNFGQKIGEERKDIFDKTMESTTDAYTKEYIGQLRDRIYQKTNRNDATRLLSYLRTYTTMTKLSSVWSSIRNLSSVFTNTVPEFGVSTSVPEAVKVLLRFGNEVKRTQEAGALKADLTAGFTEMHDLSDAQRKAANVALKFSGFNLAEDFNRAHAAATARAWARWALNKIEANPNGRSSILAQAKFKKFGVNPVLLKEQGMDGSESRKLMRAAAMSTQFNYDLRQVPLWAETPVAKFLFQFQKFSLQQLRRLSDDVIAPMIKGHSINGQKVRDFRPFLYMMASAFGTGELLMMLRELLFGKGRNDASLVELENTIDQNEQRGLELLAQRLAHDLTYAGGMGSLGDWSSNIESFVTRGRAKSPIDPPGLGPLKNAWDNLILTAWQQGTLTGADIINWAKNEVPLLNYGESAIKQITGDDLFDAEKQVRTIRQLGYRYSVEMGLPTQSGQTFDKSVNTPIYRQLQEALLVGDLPVAKEAMMEFLKDAKTTEQKKKKLLALQASVRLRQPFKAGAIDTEDERADFKGWLVKRVGVDELADLNAVESRYVNTAVKLGLMKFQSINLNEAMRQRIRGKMENALQR